MANSKHGHGLRGGHVPYGDRYGYNGIGETVSHYYGDLVRQFFLGAAAVMLFGAPFYGDNVRSEFPFVVVGALIIVCLAALTNPWKKWILAADAISAGVGMAVYQMWALSGYGVASNVAFVLKEAISIIFLFSFYFSVKTVRAMVLHQIGKRASLDEFADQPTANEDEEEDSADDDATSKMKHAFDEDPLDLDPEIPPHKPNFYEKTDGV